MQKIQLTLEQAQAIAQHLSTTEKDFCLTIHGIVSREYLAEHFNIII